LSECETWRPILKKKYCGIKNKTLRTIFERNWRGVTEGYRILQSERVFKLHALPSIMGGTKSRSLGWEHYVEGTGEIVNAYKIVVRKEKGKRLFGRPTRRWEDNMRTDLKEIWQPAVG
jgi:hypothetical protein